MSMHLILKMPSSHYSLFLFRLATSRSAQQISSADSHLNRSAISGSAVYQQKLDQLSDQLSSTDSIMENGLYRVYVIKYAIKTKHHYVYNYETSKLDLHYSI